MSKTSIEWTDASWNPIVGCTEVSPGCANCYAARLAATRLREVRAYQGLASGEIQKVNHHRFERRGIRWTGEVRFLPERLEEPLHWKKPQRIFVCDMGDLFHEGVRYEWKQKIFWVMRDARHHTFQVLTKRPRLMLEFISEEFGELHEPIPNIWLGVSVENQHFADERVPLLLDTPAAVRFISAEPLLGPVKLIGGIHDRPTHALDWVICGGESGPNARPMHPDWARSLRDQCVAAGVPFFFKQWGEWKPVSGLQERIEADKHKCVDTGGWLFMKCGKHKAGRLLDGREWNEFPKNVETSERLNVTTNGAAHVPGKGSVGNGR